MVTEVELPYTDRMDSADVIGLWQAWLQANGLAENTSRTYSNAVAQFVSKTAKPLLQVEAMDVIAFLAGLGKFGHARADYATALRSLYGFCMAAELIEKDPTRLTKPKSPPPPPPTSYSEEETIRLIIAARLRSRTDRKAWALVLGFALGTRRSELAGIRPDDVDFTERTVRLRGKGGKERIVELGPLALAAIEGLRPYWNGTLLGGIKPQTITWWVNSSAKDCGLPARKHRSHVAFRATSISYLFSKGAPAPVIRDRVGHENIRTTDRYAASFPEQRRQYAEML